MHLLDEVSSVPQWQRAVKFLRDQTPSRGDCFVLTGSSARDIRIGGERLPGRREPTATLDKVLLPMSFCEFCVARGLPPPPAVLDLAAFLDAPAALREGVLMGDELDRALELYTSSGGFPPAVVDVMQTGQVAASTVRALWDTVAGANVACIRCLA